MKILKRIGTVICWLCGTGCLYFIYRLFLELDRIAGPGLEPMQAGFLTIFFGVGGSSAGILAMFLFGWGWLLWKETI